MLQLTQYEILKILRQRGNWFALAFWIFASALLFFSLLKDYVFQVQLATVAPSGVTQEVVKPFWGWTLFGLYIGTPILTILGLSIEHSQKAYHFWIMHRIQAFQYVFSKLLAILSVQTISLLLILSIPLSLCLLTTLDFGLLFSGFATVWCMMFFMASLSFALYVATFNTFLSLVLTYSCVFLFSILPGFSTLPKLTQFLNALSPLQHAHGLMNGRFYVHDTFYFVLIITTFIAFCLVKMQARFQRLG